MRLLVLPELDIRREDEAEVRACAGARSTRGTELCLLIDDADDDDVTPREEEEDRN